MPDRLPNCSFLNQDGTPCGESASHVVGVTVGMWMMGCWACPQHKPLMEMLLPPVGAAQAGLAQVKRNPVIVAIESLRQEPDRQELFVPELTCDGCSLPIYRDLETGVWMHVGKAASDHEVRPG